MSFLRLDYQSSVLADDKLPALNYRQHAFQRIPQTFPETPLRPSRLSAAGSLTPLVGVILRILAAMAKTNWGPCARVSLPQEDITCLDDAINMALKNGPIVPHDDKAMGGDDILWGRTGLLWILLNVRAHQFSEETQKALAPVMAKIPDLVRVIIDAGRQGSKDYIQKHGDQDAHPLMYEWVIGHYFFGALVCPGLMYLCPVLINI